MGRSRKATPGDYVVDADRGSSSVSTSKAAELLTPNAFQDRADNRAGLRDLDRMVEASGMTRQQRDRERAMPRGQSGDLGHARMERRLPAAGDTRVPLSSRQRKARSVTKRGVQDAMPETQYRATSGLISDPRHWQQVNDELSRHTGDVQQLDDRAAVQRVDRAIAAYERDNDRGHVVYTNVVMPAAINRSNLDAFVGTNFRTGDVVCFDRFSMGAHSLHEVDPADGGERTAVFEIQTRRGMYLGRSDSLDNTAHLLPRGMRFRVVGAHRATYQRPDGSTGQRTVIQLLDSTEE